MKSLDTSYKQTGVVHTTLRVKNEFLDTSYKQTGVVYTALQVRNEIQSKLYYRAVINTELNEIPPYSDFILLESGHYVLTEQDTTSRGLSSLMPVELQYNTRDDVP